MSTCIKLQWLNNLLLITDEFYNNIALVNITNFTNYDDCVQGNAFRLKFSKSDNKTSAIIIKKIQCDKYKWTYNS